jgi:RND superfamily putative drug exporter
MGGITRRLCRRAAARPGRTSLIGIETTGPIESSLLLARLILAPAVMHILGRATWWLPPGVARRLPRLSVEGPAVPEPTR